jgi:hypothetical protein
LAIIEGSREKRKAKSERAFIPKVLKELLNVLVLRKLLRKHKRLNCQA